MVPAGWNGGNRFWQPASYDPLKVALPEVPGAEFVKMDEFCASCHKTYSEAFTKNVHRAIGCEECHGAASNHLKTRGMQPDTIFGFGPRDDDEALLRDLDGDVLEVVLPGTPDDERFASHSPEE